MTKIRRIQKQRSRWPFIFAADKTFHLVICGLLATAFSTLTLTFLYMPKHVDLKDSLQDAQFHYNHMNMYHPPPQQEIANHRHYEIVKEFDASKPELYHEDEMRNYRQRRKSRKRQVDDKIQNDFDADDDNDADIDIDVDPFNQEFLFPFQNEIEEEEVTQLNDYVNSIRDPIYESHPSTKSDLDYNIHKCPNQPPHNYPAEWPLLDVLHNWNPNETTFTSMNSRPKIYAALCRFDYNNELDRQKAFAYRKAEKPFIFRNDPAVLQTVKRWNTPNYLSDMTMGRKGPGALPNGKYSTEYSESNHLMFYRVRENEKKPKGWKPPIQSVDMTYDEWEEKASQHHDQMSPDKPHWYFRVNAKNKSGNHHFLYEELPFFKPKENFYIVDKSDTRGINCRFGMEGNIAETHFDGSRNFIMLFGGERRYILSSPKQCPHLGLYPRSHPSGRHSAIDWTNPDLEAFPEFKNAFGNEVVLQAGDVLYLPTHWFHFIVSLNLNWQCNARSGITDEYYKIIKACGF
mmetsp:Transcript_15651/g.18188  ORF Transcript_15651/g.18188 Transcript_15651/m.18188 type:complete len:516 (+) Transcript_15651:104-1651(+)